MDSIKKDLIEKRSSGEELNRNKGEKMMMMTTPLIVLFFEIGHSPIFKFMFIWLG